MLVHVLNPKPASLIKGYAKSNSWYHFPTDNQKLNL